MTTPVSVWGVAFEQAGFPWLKTFPIEDVFEGPLQDYRIQGTFRCKLCEQTRLKRGELEPHARHHKFEYRQWLVERERERREQAAQLKIGEAA